MAFEEIHTITTLKQGVCATISYKPIATNSGRKLTPKLIIGIPKAQAAGFSPAKDATVFTSRFDDLPEPLCALWEPSSHARLKARYDAGSYCPRKALIQSDIVLLPAPGDALDNINTPEEFAQMQRQLESQP